MKGNDWLLVHPSAVGPDHRTGPDVRSEMKLSPRQSWVAVLLVLGAGFWVVGCSDDPGTGDETVSEQALLVHLPSTGAGFSLDEIEDPLIAAIDDAGVGEFDGNEIGAEGAILYMYGPDAEALFVVVEPVLRQMELPDGSYLVKRFGPPGSEESRVALGQ